MSYKIYKTETSFLSDEEKENEEEREKHEQNCCQDKIDHKLTTKSNDTTKITPQLSFKPISAGLIIPPSRICSTRCK